MAFYKKCLSIIKKCFVCGKKSSEKLKNNYFCKECLADTKNRSRDNKILKKSK